MSDPLNPCYGAAIGRQQLPGCHGAHSAPYGADWPVIARSAAAKQSTIPWFALKKLLRVARNDEIYFVLGRLSAAAQF